MNKDNFDFLDLLSIMSFVIGLQSYELANKNLKENREQTADTNEILNLLNQHLFEQDQEIINLKDHLKKQDDILNNIIKKGK